MKSESKIVSFFNALFVQFRHISFFNRAEAVIDRMGSTEKIFFYIFSSIVIICGAILLVSVNNSFLVEVPAPGGKFTEGIIGSPRFINPVLAISDTDKDLSSIIYSGLLKSDGKGSYSPDLANAYSISETGTEYDVTIREDAYFHDGRPVTSDDIIFTIEKILDPVIKSPKRANWEGVYVEKISDKEIKFTLSKPYAPFLEAMTVGILPKHIWEKVSSEEFPFSGFNINPIGSGPYKVDKISRNSGGIPSTIILSPFNKYIDGKPKIKSITFKFYQNETELINAYNKKDVDSIYGLGPANFSVIGKETSSLSPRIFGVFFNQNVAQVFANKEVRTALNMSAPKLKIIDEALYGLAKPLNGPTPENIEDSIESGNIEGARQILESFGWKPDENGTLEKKTKEGTTPLKFAISTSDVPELKKAAEILRDEWITLGADVELKVFESGDLNQNVIRGRKYDALLFGEVVSNESDLYPFWHSSQRNDPGLNIALYANITVDKLLDEMQKSNADISEKRDQVISEIKNDLPAVFLFSPNLNYLQPNKVRNISLKKISFPSERFSHVNEWYIETDKVWKFIASYQNNHDRK